MIPSQLPPATLQRNKAPSNAGVTGPTVSTGVEAPEKPTPAPIGSQPFPELISHWYCHIPEVVATL